MNTFKTLAIAAVASLTLASAPSAQAANGRNAAIGLGLLGGAILGAALAGPSYARPVARPVYHGGEYGECVRRTVGYTYDGYPVRRTFCN